MPARPLTLLLALVLAAPAAAGPARDELFRYVPDDAGFCLVVENLRGRLSDLADSPFMARWAKSEVGSGLLASREWRKLLSTAGYLEKHLGVRWAELRDDVLGDALVFAYKPGPMGKPEQEQGLFLLRASSAKTLEQLIARLHEWQKRTGELTGLDEREYRGVKYYRRREVKETNYYLLRGPVLIFTGQEAALRQAIDREKANATPAGLAARFKELQLDGAVAALAINPRAFDAAVAAQGGESHPARTFAACWKAVQGIGLSLHLESDLQVKLSLRVQTDQLPAAARRLFPAAAKPSALWANVPEDALLAVGGQVDLTAWYELVSEFLSKDTREAFQSGLEHSVGAILGRSAVKDVLPAIGPDWGLYVTAPPASGHASAGRSWAPQWTFAVRLARGDESDPIDEAILQVVQTWAQFGVLNHNKHHTNRPLALRTRLLDGVRVRYLSGGIFPPDTEPAFGLKAGHLVVASSPAEVARFRAPPATAAGKSVPVLQVSTKALRGYLKDRREALASALARPEQMTKEQALARLDAARAGLEVVDRVELRQQVGAGFSAFTLTIQPAAPFRPQR